MHLFATLPHMKVRGWDGRGPFKDCGFVTLETLSAFSDARNTDAMAVAYVVPGDELFPRLNSSALPTLVSAGQEPLLNWVFLDIDNPGHAKWSDLGTAYLALAAAVEASGMGGYTTRAGLRLVAPVSPRFRCHLRTPSLPSSVRP